MQGFYFGPEGSRLFGVYQPPLVSADRDFGVVVCNPFGAEYLRAHRALRRLGLRLARTGFHVLRFDYRGTGDSAGSLTDASLENWETDTLAAMDALKKESGVSQLSIIGMRLGAAIGCLAARSRRDVRSLVLWEPIWDGSAYLEELWSTHQAWIDHRPWVTSRGVRRADPAWDMLGLSLGVAMRQSIAGLSLQAFKRRLAERALVICADARASAEAAATVKEAKLAEVVEEAACPVSVWRDEEDEVQGVVPAATLTQIAGWLGADAA